MSCCPVAHRPEEMTKLRWPDVRPGRLCVREVRALPMRHEPPHRALHRGDNTQRERGLAEGTCSSCSPWRACCCAEWNPPFEHSSVLKNIAHLCGRTKSKMWGPDGWKKVVVCVVSDGRSKINKRTLQVLTLVRVPAAFAWAFGLHTCTDGLLPGRYR